VSRSQASVTVAGRLAEARTALSNKIPWVTRLPLPTPSISQMSVSEYGPRDRISPIRFCLALGGLCLVGVTWRLWQPQDVFPRVPLLEVVCQLPPIVDRIVTWIALALSCLTLLGIVGRSRASLVGLRWSAVLLSGAWATLVVLDQHRMQPWVVHVAVSLLLACWALPGRQLAYLRIFTISIYVYSALGKFDAQFLHTVGQDMVQQVLAQLGLTTVNLATSLRLGFACVLPLIELLVGLGLLWRPTRVWAGWLAVGMHLVLMWILGPWGLQHAWGVLVWNCLFVALDVLLFILPQDVVPVKDLSSVAVASHAARVDQQSIQPASPNRLRSQLMLGLLWLALIVPLGERFGWVDHWLGWALYAPHSSRARIEISVSAIEQLPANMRPFVTAPAPNEVIWSELRCDRWSLAALAAPVVPQQRFQMGIARAVSEWVGPYEIRVVAQGPANRWNGRRRVQTLTGRQEVLAAADQFWFNTRPTPTPQKFAETRR